VKRFDWSTLAAAAALICTVLLAGPASATAQLVAQIDLSAQRMDVYVDGSHRYSWAVSTARRGFRTPVGTFRPTRLHRMWYSQRYDYTPMPYSIFFHRGYAIHGTDVLKRLGRPASHGCVRLHPRHAATLYSLVKSYGKANTRVRVVR
jgi:lipoprotein-anchoring transpeptidase ErfK/SrfK